MGYIIGAYHRLLGVGLVRNDGIKKRVLGKIDDARLGSNRDTKNTRW